MADLFSSDWFSKGSGADAWLAKKRKENALAQEQQDNLAKLTAAQPEAQAPQPQGNIFQKAAGATGNFIKSAALDLKDTTVGAVTGIGTMIESPFKQAAANHATDQANEILKKNSAMTANWSEADYDDPKKKAMVQANLDAANKLLDQSRKINEGDKVKDLDAKKLAGQAAETVINVGTLGVGDLAFQGGKAVVKQGAKMVGKELIEDTAKVAAKAAAKKAAEDAALTGGKKIAANAGKDALIGGGFGASSTLAQNPDASGEDIIKGTLMGGALGGAIPIVGGALKKGLSAVTKTAKHVDAPVVGQVADTTPRNADGTVDVNKMLNDAVQTAKDKHEQGFLGKVKDVISQHANPLGFAREIDQKTADRLGVEYKNLPADQSLEHLIQSKGNVDNIVNTLAREKTGTGDSFQDLAKKYAGDTPESKEFANYTAAKYDLDRRNAATGGGARQEVLGGQKTEDLQKFVDDYETKNPTAVKDMQTKNAFYQHAAQQLHEGGLISKKELDDITSSSDVATPFNRIFADKEALDGTQAPGRRTGSIAGQTVIKGIKGGTEPIDASLDVVLERVHKAIGQRIDNNIANRLRDAAEHNDVGGRVFQEAGAKEAKAAARNERIQTNKSVRVLTKKMGLSQRQANKLETEVNNLNKAGVNVATKAREDLTPKQPIKTVTVKTVGDVVKDNAPKVIDELKQPLAIRQMLAREYGEGADGMAQMAADVHNGGWNQLLALGPDMNKNTAKSIAGQVLKAPTVKEGGITVTEGQIGRTPSIRSTIESLYTKTPKELTAIQKKIATREPKLAAKLDKVIEHKQLIDSQKAVVEDLQNIEVGLTREGTNGKAFINGVQDGQMFRVELPPKIINRLDKLSRTEVNGVLKVIGAVNQVFRIAWVGALAPGFAVKSAIWDTTMGVVNSPDGFRTLGPKAVIASVKALTEKDEFLQKLRKAGASTVGSSQLGIHSKVSAESLSATKNLFSRVKFGAKNPQATIDSLDVFGGKLASLTRTRTAKAAYDRSIKQGMSEEKALATAAYTYNNIMPDFATMSPLIRQINTLIPFTNASIAGTRSLAQGFKRAPLATAAKVAGLGVAPAVAVAAYSLSSQSGRDFYQDMHDSGNDATLNNNLIVVLPGAHKDDKTGEWSGIIKLPMTPEFRNINSQAWRTVEGIHGGKGNDPKQAAMDLFDTVTGSVRTLSSPLVDIKTILDGKDPRTGKALVGDNLKDLPQDQQAYDTTSAAGRDLGKFIGTSPIQADKILGSFGTAGSALKSGSTVDALSGNAKNTYTGAYGQKTATAFYDTYSPVKAARDKASKEVTDLVKVGKINEAKRKADSFNESLTGKFKDFHEKYSKSDAYNKNWNDMMNGLFISTSEDSFNARVSPN